MKKMRERGRLVAALVVAAACTMMAGGCAETDFDAGGYVSASIDALYKGEYEKYADFIGTSVEEAKKDIEKSNDEMVQQAFSGENIPPEDGEAYKQAAIDGYKQAKYEIKEVIKEDDGNYVVKMSIWPSTVFVVTENMITTKVQARMEATGQDFDMGEIAAVATECIRDNIGSSQYRDEVAYEVHVKKDDKNVYGIPDQEMEEIDLLLFPQE